MVLVHRQPRVLPHRSFLQDDEAPLPSWNYHRPPIKVTSKVRSIHLPITSLSPHCHLTITSLRSHYHLTFWLTSSCSSLAAFALRFSSIASLDNNQYRIKIGKKGLKLPRISPASTPESLSASGDAFLCLTLLAFPIFPLTPMLYWACLLAHGWSETFNEFILPLMV